MVCKPILVFSLSLGQAEQLAWGKDSNLYFMSLPSDVNISENILYLVEVCECNYYVPIILKRFLLCNENDEICFKRNKD